PKAIRTTAATRPPISNNLRMVRSFRVGRCSSRRRPGSLMDGVCERTGAVKSWPARNRVAGFPQRSVEEAARHGPADELRPALEPELAHQPRALAFDRPKGDLELACDVAIRVTARDQDRCGPLALGEVVVDHARN